MAKVNKYGRQVFLSREEIRSIRDMCELRIMSLADEISYHKDEIELYKAMPDDELNDTRRSLLQTFEEELPVFEAEKVRLERLVEKKLWYYVADEAEVQ